MDQRTTGLACPLCNSRNNTRLAKGFRGVMQCRDCQFIFAAPSSDPAASELYDEEWAKSETHPTFIYRNGEFVVRHPEKIRAILRRIEPYRKLNRLLDVGCSAAFFLKQAEEGGWSVKGVEVADFGVKYSREILKLEVFQGMLHEAALPDASFDVVFNSHVLEHVSQPRDFVRDVHRVLRPGGAMVTVIPTQYAAPAFRLSGRITGESPPRHVSFFVKKTFTDLMQSEGFDVVSVQQNSELQRLFSKTSEGTPSATGPAAQREDEARRTTQTRRKNLFVRMVKASVNAVGSAVGIGDELTAVAVKR